MPSIGKYQRREKLIGVSISVLIAIAFLLLHSNQRSSQSMASVILLLGPCVFFLINPVQLVQLKHTRWLLFFVTLYCGYNFLIFTRYPVSQVSFGKFRDLMFWLILPLCLVAFHRGKIQYQHVFYLFLAAGIFCLSPIVNDLLTGERRGNSSAQPIYWGNIALSTGIVGFVLSRYWKTKLYNILGYTVLFFGLAASLWSQTRGGWISIPVSFILMMYFRVIGWRHVIIACTLLAVLFISLPEVRERVKRTLVHLGSHEAFEQNDAARVRSSLQQRFDMWRFALEHVSDSPVTGSGLAAYKDKIDEVHHETGMHQAIKRHKNVHSEYLEILLSRGIVGFILFIMIIASSLSLFVRKMNDAKDRYIRIAGYLLVSQFMIFALTEMFFSAKYTIVYFCIVLALLISVKYNVEPERETAT